MNALVSSVVRVDGRTMSLNEVQLLNAILPMLVHNGKLTEVNLTQNMNAKFPMLVHNGKLTEVKEVQL